MIPIGSKLPIVCASFHVTEGHQRPRSESSINETNSKLTRPCCSSHPSDSQESKEEGKVKGKKRMFQSYPFSEIRKSFGFRLGISSRVVYFVAAIMASFAVELWWKLITCLRACGECPNEVIRGRLIVMLLGQQGYKGCIDAIAAWNANFLLFSTMLNKT